MKLNRIKGTLLIAVFIISTITIAIPTAIAATWIVDDDGPADFSTIQAAIDAANPDDTITVLAGTYIEWQDNGYGQSAGIIIDKPLHLQGSGDDCIIRGKTGTVYYLDNSPLILVKADNVEIDHFKFDGATYTEEEPKGLRSYGIQSAWSDSPTDYAATNLNVHHNTFVFIGQAVTQDRAGGGDITVAYNTMIRETRTVWYKPAGATPGSYVEKTLGGGGVKFDYVIGGTVHDNTGIETPGVGIFLHGCEDLTIGPGNIISAPSTDPSDEGVHIQGCTNIDVIDNTIMGFKNGEDPYYNHGKKGAAIGIDGSSDGVSIEENDIKENSVGVYCTSPTNVIVKQNNIENNDDYGVLNCKYPESGNWNHWDYEIFLPADSIVDASMNWWGITVQSEVADMVSELIDFNPWLPADFMTSLSDADEDSFPYYEEVALGTDPNDPLDYPGAPVEDYLIADVAEGIGTVDATDDTGTVVDYKAKDDTTITVSKYEEAPEDDTSFSALGEYIDVRVDDPENLDSITIKLGYTDTDPGVEPSKIGDIWENNLRMYYWDGSNWVQCSETGVTMAEDYIWATIDMTTNPDLNYLSGGPFGPGDIEIELDSEFYHTGDTVTVTVTDTFENADPIRKETVKVDATSDTDIAGITVTLTETGVNTGVFEGTFPVVPTTPEPGTDELGVSDGDEIEVDYEGAKTTAIVDDTEPVFVDPFVTGPEFCRNTDTITLTVTLDDLDCTVTADFSVIDSECTAPVTATGTYTITYTIDEDNTKADGEYTITVTAEDVAGNTATDTVPVNLDNTGPSITDLEADPSLIQPETETDITFTATVSDSGSDVASVTIDLTAIEGDDDVLMTLDGDVYICTLAVTVASDGYYDLIITAKDNVGNTNEETIILHVVADTEGPTDVSFTEVESICGGLIVKGLSAYDDSTGVMKYQIYMDEDDFPLVEITVDDLASDTWTAGLYKGTFVLDLSGYVDTTVEVTVVAYDNAGNPSDPVTLYAGKVPKGKWSPVELYKGWNLVSLPLIPDSSARGDILSLILDRGASGVVVSYGYDQYTDTWITNPAEMTDGYGYWLYALGYDVMIVEGVDKLGPPSPPATYEFTAGWVLAGYKSTTPMVANEYIVSLEEASYFSTVYVWDAVTPAWSTLNVAEETTNDILPGQGFWIWMYSDQNLIPPMEGP